MSLGKGTLVELKRAMGIDPKIRFFHMPSGVEVTWGATEKSCIYHATFDGKEALCRRSIRLVSENPYPFCSDPSMDIMACELCQGLVRRIEEKSPDRA